MEFRSPAPQKGLGKGVRGLLRLLGCRRRHWSLAFGPPCPQNEKSDSEGHGSWAGQNGTSGCCPVKASPPSFSQPGDRLRHPMGLGVLRHLWPSAAAGVCAVPSFPLADGEAKAHCCSDMVGGGSVTKGQNGVQEHVPS